MKELSHQEARVFLQKDADQMLHPEDKSVLDAHLKQCNQCREYAASLTILDGKLRSILHKKWDAQEPEMLTPQMVSNPSSKSLMWNFSTPIGFMGKATLVATMLLGYFVLANILGIRLPTSGDKPVPSLPTPTVTSNLETSPTPSAQFTLTGSTSQTCESFIYIVQENETLASIAQQHHTTKELILAYNELPANTVFTGQELIILVCNGTPPLTATLPENTSTITPVNSGTSFPTQPQ